LTFVSDAPENRLWPKHQDTITGLVAVAGQALT